MSPKTATDRRSSKRATTPKASLALQSWLWLEVLGLLVLGVALAFVFTSVVPPDMDEHLAHHFLACFHYPFNYLNTFRESCTGYDLSVLNSLVLPLRANAYVGNVHALLYWPLFAIWSSPVSLRFFAYLLLLIQAAFVARILQSRLSFAVVALLLCFPYAFTHLADTGPVGFQTTSVFAVLYLWQSWGKQPALWKAVLASVLMAAGVWSKLTYFWMLPGIVLLLCHEFWLAHAVIWTPDRRRQTLTHVLAALIVFVALTALYMLGSNPNTQDFTMLQQMWDSPKYSLGQWLNGDWLASGILITLLNPLEAAQRQFSIPASGTFLELFAILTYLSVPLCLFLLRHIKPKSDHQARAATAYVGFLLTLFFMISTKRAWMMHHTVLSFPFLIIAGAYTLAALRPKWKPTSWRMVIRLLASASAAIFVAGNIALYSLVTTLQFRPSDEPGRMQLNAFLHHPYLASHYLYVVTDWGMYYTQALYGHSSQSVLYIEPFNAAYVETLRTLAKSQNRRLLFIYLRSSPSSEIIHGAFEVQPCQRGALSRQWGLLLEPDTDIRNPCRVFPRAQVRQ